MHSAVRMGADACQATAVASVPGARRLVPSAALCEVLGLAQGPLATAGPGRRRPRVTV